MKKRIQIFDTCWDVHYQWNMIFSLKEVCDFYFCLNTVKQWNSTQYPIPQNLKFVTHYEPHSYDVAILHIDEEIIGMDHQKRMMYEQFDEIITDIPKIVINHGIPVFPERFRKPRRAIAETLMRKECIRIVKELIKSNTMVVHSFTGASKLEWGFGVPIIPGIDSNTYIDLPKEPRIYIDPPDFHYYSYYNYNCLLPVLNELSDKYGYHTNILSADGQNNLLISNYKEYLGRSLLFLDTSYRMPLNNVRIEAMLSGCCVLQVEGAHDLERWAKPDKNIVLLPNDPKNIILKIINFLEEKYTEAIKIGIAGKETAMKEFSIEKFRNQWIEVLDFVINKKMNGQYRIDGYNTCKSF